MSNKLELSNSGWAILRDPAAVPVRLRRPVEKVMIEISQGSAGDALKSAPSDLSDEAKAAEVASNLDISVYDTFNNLNDLLIVARVESWSFNTEVNLDSVLDLCAQDYEILQTATADRVEEMLPSFAVSVDQNSPIKPSDV